MRLNLLISGIPSLFLLFVADAYGEWLLDTSVALQYNDNLPNASLDQDIKKDSVFEFSLAPGYHKQLTGYTGLTLSADLGVNRQLEYDGLDNITTGINADIRKKFGLGLYAPWTRVSGSARYINYDDGQRDGWLYTAAIDAGKLLTERFSVRVGYRYERRRTDHSVDIPFLVTNFGIRGDAFDTDAHYLDLNGMYQINQRLSVVLGYTFRTGEITSTTLRNNEIFEASDAISVDPVFGADRFAYRISADTSIFSAVLSLVLTQRMSFNISYAYRDSDAYEDLSYSNNLVRASLLYSY